ncbi:hypothetical protein ACUXQ2_006351 [Cupriavidus metallidurans]|uniref:hypothetical protein n=1 Tax=Cupriavidus sp. HMR-1 TaxID=1249621 RepID=UPI0002A39125|nr:hypothetical protein [Cupriavidus sp. HMR-1]EKZ99016.1 hypothetical protein D769_12241 [Cupriavidus sp. HMR-1]
MSVAVEAVPLSIAPIDTQGKTIADVVTEIYGQLRAADLEPEWIDAANFGEDENEALYGPNPLRPWPELGSRDRFAVSIHRGQSEGWIVYVDRIGRAGEAHSMVATVQKLITAKTLSQRHGWQLVHAITKMIDVA